MESKFEAGNSDFVVDLDGDHISDDLTNMEEELKKELNLGDDKIDISKHEIDDEIGLGGHSKNETDDDDDGEDIPDSFFKDFEDNDFMEGLNVVDAWVDEDAVDKDKKTVASQFVKSEEVKIGQEKSDSGHQNRTSKDHRKSRDQSHIHARSGSRDHWSIKSRSHDRVRPRSRSLNRRSKSRGRISRSRGRRSRSRGRRSRSRGRKSRSRSRKSRSRGRRSRSRRRRSSARSSLDRTISRDRAALAEERARLERDRRRLEEEKRKLAEQSTLFNLNNEKIEQRRDPEKTKRDIERDKVKKVMAEQLRIAETGLVPPGTELDVITTKDGEITNTLQPPKQAPVLDEISVRKVIPHSKITNSHLSRSPYRPLLPSSTSHANEKLRSFEKELEVFKSSKKQDHPLDIFSPVSDKKLSQSPTASDISDRERWLRNDRKDRGYNRRSMSVISNNSVFSISPDRSREKKRSRDTSTRTRRSRPMGKRSFLEELEEKLREDSEKRRKLNNPVASVAHPMGPVMHGQAPMLSHPVPMLSMNQPYDPFQPTGFGPEQMAVPTPVPAPVPPPAPFSMYGNFYQPQPHVVNPTSGMYPTVVHSSRAYDPYQQAEARDSFPVSSGGTTAPSNQVKPASVTPLAEPTKLAELFQDKKISLSDFLSISAKKLDSSTVPKVEVILRCQEALKMFDESFSMSGRFCPMIAVTEKPFSGKEDKYKSPMRKLMRFQFTTPSKEPPKDKHNLMMINRMLTYVNLKPLAVPQPAPAVEQKTKSPERLRPSQPLPNMLNKSVQTDRDKCKVCELRQSRVFVSYAVQTDDKLSLDICIQVNQEDLPRVNTSPRGILKNSTVSSHSIAHLTPAQIMAQINRKEETAASVHHVQNELFPDVQHQSEHYQNSEPSMGFSGNEAYGGLRAGNVNAEHMPYGIPAPNNFPIRSRKKNDRRNRNWWPKK